MSTLIFYAQFTASKVGKQDLTVTVDIARITRSDGTQATSVTGGSATQIASPNKRGWYLYVLTGADNQTYDYACTFITADATVDQQEIPAIRTMAIVDETANKIADHVRRRTQANVEASADGDALSVGSHYGQIQEAQNASVSGATLTIKKTDGTALGTKTLTTDGSALPVVGIT